MISVQPTNSDGGDVLEENIFLYATAKAGFIPFWTNFFRFWRGSIEFKVKFFGPPLFTLRYCMALIMPNAPVPGTQAEVLAAVGDAFTIVGTARGTTTVAFSVPFMKRLAWQKTQGNDEMPVIAISNFDFPAETVVSIPYVVFWRIGDDFRFSSFQSARSNRLEIITPPMREAEAQGGIQDVDDVPTEVKVFGNKAPPSPMYDFRASTGELPILLNRPTSRSRFIDWLSGPGITMQNQPPGFPEYEIAFFEQSDILDQVSVLYLYWTGALKYKTAFLPDNLGNIAQGFNFVQITLPNENENFVGDDQGTPPLRTNGDGSFVTDTRLWSVLEFSVPFLTEYLVAPTLALDVGKEDDSLVEPVKPLVTDNQNPPVTPIPDAEVYVQPGGDFRFYGLWPPPPDFSRRLRTVTTNSEPFIIT